MVSERWVSLSGCPQGFCRSNKHCGCPATTNRGSVHSRAGPNSGMENEAFVVFARRRGPHDQSEDSKIHGRAHGRKRSITRSRPQPDVHEAKSSDRRDLGCGASNPFAIAKRTQFLLRRGDSMSVTKSV